VQQPQPQQRLAPRYCLTQQTQLAYKRQNTTPYPPPCTNMRASGTFARKPRFLEHIDLNMSNSRQGMVRHPTNDFPQRATIQEPASQQLDTQNPTHCQCTRRSFDDFVPRERISTWHAEDQKAKEKKTSGKRSQVKVQAEKVFGKAKTIKTGKQRS
jgi:hypothetical protein